MKALLFCLALASSAFSADWNGYERIDFVINDKASHLIKPKQAALGNPWIWRTEFFGHEPQADLALLAQGFHVAYTHMQNQYGAPVAIDHMAKFHDAMIKDHALSAKVVLEGFSRGGLFALNYAAAHPHRVACLYLDAPVCDFKSWPAGFGKGKGSPADWQRCRSLYGFADDEAAKASKLAPIDNLQTMATAKVPILSVVGDVDKVVPLDENSAVLKARYTALGGPMEMIVKPGVDHHPHSLKDPAPIVEFILKHTR